MKYFGFIAGSSRPEGGNVMKRHSAILAMQGAFIALLLISVFSCQKVPESIEDLSNKIRNVTYSEQDELKVARIELDGVFGSDEANYFFKVTKEMSKILRKVAIYFPENQQQIDFILKVTLHNNISGRSSDRIVLEIPFTMSEIKKIRFYNSSNWDILNRSEQIRFAHPIGRNIVQSFCSVGNYKQHASRFCLAAKI